jgi:endonuclease YncB( thermonuclease family)
MVAIFLLLGLVGAETLYGTISNCYDGDTCTAQLDNPNDAIPAIFAVNLGIRILGVDTPEIRGACDLEKCLAQIAKSYTYTRVDGKKVKLENSIRDKYFRVVADLQYEEGGKWKSINQELISYKIAVEYDGGTKVTDWCDESENTFFYEHTKKCMQYLNY